MRKKHLLISILAVCTFFTKNFAQVNLQNGSPQVSYPLFSISDPNNRLSAGVVLNYTGGNGIKVDDMGSSVGTGWDLSTGPSVTRIQHGEPDDQKEGVKNICNYPLRWLDGYLYNVDNATYVTDPSIPVTNGAIWKSKKLDGFGAGFLPYSNKQLLSASDKRYLADREIDEFVLNINGANILFFIGRGIPKKVFFENETYNNYRIEVIWDESLSMPNVLTTIRGFIVTDPTGIQYNIQDMEMSELISYDIFNSFLNVDGTYEKTSNTLGCPQNTNFGPYQNYTYQQYSAQNTSSSTDFRVKSGFRTGVFVGSRWLVTKVINPLTNRSINYFYNDVIICRRGSISVTYTNGISNSNDDYTFFETLISNKVKKINRISNADQDKIEFNYQTDGRIDLNGDKILMNVKFFKNNNFLEQVNFQTGYFLKRRIAEIDEHFSEQDKVFLRICLKSITKTNGNNKTQKLANFDYILNRITNTDDYLPDYDIVTPMFSIYKDHWGYYNGLGGLQQNGDGNGPAFDFARYPKTLNDCYRKQTLASLVKSFYGSPNPNLPKQLNTEDLLICSNGLLKSISNELGGKTVYEYEPNIITDIKQVNALPTLQYNDKTVGGVRVKSLSFIDENNGKEVSRNVYEYPKDSKGLNSGWGSCWGYYSDAIYSINNDISISINDGNKIYGSEQLAIASQSVFAAQLSNLINQKFSLPSGIKFALLTIYEIISSIVSGGAVPIYNDYSIVNFSSEAINQNRFVPLSYKIVKVSNHKNNIKAGYSITELTSWDDYQVDVSNDPTSASNQLMLGFKFNLPKRISVYDSKDKLLKQQLFNYSDNQAEIVEPSYRLKSQKWVPKKTVTQFSVFWNYVVVGSNGYNVFLPSSVAGSINETNYLTFTPTYFPFEDGLSDKIDYKIYTPIKGNIQITNTEEKNYGDKIKSFNTTGTRYNSHNLISGKSQKNSKGEIVETIYKYASDYTVTGAIGLLNQSNNITAPILSETYITKPNGVKYLVSGSITDYEIIQNGDIKPTKIYSFRSETPIEESSLQPFDPNQIIHDPSYYELVSTMHYDSKGSLVETKTESSIASIIENVEVPGQVIASVNNAKKTDIAYSSFETAKDNDNIVYDDRKLTNEYKLTGNYSYNFSNKIVSVISKNGLTENKKYKVSFWYKPKPNSTNNIPIVNLGQYNYNGSFYWYSNNATPVLVYTNVVTGWSLYELEIVADAHKTVNIINQIGLTNTAFDALIDELRIYPIESEMQSATFNIKGQKTSDCDASNRIRYYEYDAFDRLMLIREENRNVIKTFEYNIK